MPRAVQAQMIHPRAYGDEGGAGAPYKLLDSLPEVRDYAAPEIICNAIRWAAPTPAPAVHTFGNRPAGWIDKKK